MVTGRIDPPVFNIESDFPRFSHCYELKSEDACTVQSSTYLLSLDVTSFI